MELKDLVAVVTGGAQGIGRTVCHMLAERQVKAIGVADLSETTASVCAELNAQLGRDVLVPFRGNTVDADFRESVFAQMEERYGAVSLCVPAAGITSDRLAVKIDNKDGSPSLDIYDEAEFRRVLDIDLIAPIYWAMRTVGSVAMDRARRGLGRWRPEESNQGGIVLIGSAASAGNRGQISYATAKAGLAGAQATLSLEAAYYGMRCAIIHPGFTDTPMAHAVGEDIIQNSVLPKTYLGRLIRPEEIGEAICFLLTNSSVSGSLWASAGWRPIG